MWAQRLADQSAKNAQEFSEILLKIGERKEDMFDLFGEDDFIRVPDKLCIKGDQKSLINQVFPNLDKFDM